MNADYGGFKYKELIEKIIKVFYKVYNKLVYGFSEKVYENAMMMELREEIGGRSGKVCVLIKRGGSKWL